MSDITFVGIFGTLVFGIITLLNLGFYWRLEEDTKTTIEMFLLRSKIGQALKFMLVSVLIFGVSGTVSLIGTRMGNPMLAQAIRVGFLVFFAAYMLFFVALYLSSSPEDDFPSFLENLTGMNEKDSTS